MAAVVPTVWIGRAKLQTPHMTYVGIGAVAVVTLAVGVSEEDVFGKQDGACCNRVGVPEVEVVGKQGGALRIGSRRP